MQNGREAVKPVAVCAERDGFEDGFGAGCGSLRELYPVLDAVFAAHRIAAMAVGPLCAGVVAPVALADFPIGGR